MTDVNLVSQWTGGFKADYEILNSSPVAGPVSIDIRLDGDISKIWGDASFEQIGPDVFRVTVDDLAPGARADGGFVADADVASFEVISVTLPDATTDETPVAEAPPAEEAPVDDNSEGQIPALPAEGDIVVDPSISASELQSLIESAAPGATITLGAGDYHFDRTIVVDRSDIAIQGVGSEDVTIHVPGTLGEAAFEIDGGTREGDMTLKSSVNEGDPRITLDGPHSFEVGDHVYLFAENTDAFFEDIGDTLWRKDAPLRTSIVEIAEVDGNTLTFTGGVHFDFDRGETTIQEIDLLDNIALGGFTIDYGLGPADPSDFSNTLSNYNRNAVIEVEGTTGAVIHDIKSYDVPSLGLNVALSREISTDHTTFTGAHNKGAGGNGYAIQIRDVYDSSFLNHSDMDMRHSVLFASWRSAVGNEVHVLETDRDINFHGGRDHDNVVTVDRSVRDAESDIIAPTIFFNTEGRRYGAPTEEGANTATFGYVIGTRLKDDVTAYDAGAYLDGAGANDTLRGQGGDDTFRGGEGNDLIYGGGGHDTAIFDGVLASYKFMGEDDGSWQVKDLTETWGRDRLWNVETLVFDDAQLTLTDDGYVETTETTPAPEPEPTPEPDPEPAEPAPQPEPEPDPTEPDPTPSGPILTGTDGKDTFEITEENTIVHADGGWDTAYTTVDFTMSDGLEKLELVGTAPIAATGSGGDDLILGNDASNIVRGNEGDDRVFARDGDDAIFGGSGNDEIDAGSGNDRLFGGGGADTLTGRSGADTFLFYRAQESGAWGIDTITDFAAGDVIDLNRIDADTTQSDDQAFVWLGQAAGSAGAGSLWQSGDRLLGDTDGDGAADLTILAADYRFDTDDFVL
ncbi:calcium-binding protein [Maritimibacter sp. UBA3975]|uniref:calcium-binding protein n=1 Tax=Maritimibacter sp. UBA3975 TaxID=1946833 RepID=UPI000C096BE8|nr:calcium-binding protein [Maritimibacter sp. UBA3975]MAM60227.1 hypothetical protein [Maritimibacter sp.]|tara:strand:+ start:8514 stop:11075 length:2562 start_codon:yes stop_codon:yes gene_type:complete